MGAHDRPGLSGAGAGQPRAAGHGSSGRAAIEYARANPQVFVLLVICVVLGLGTFLAVLLGLLTAGSSQTTGEPSGAIIGMQALHAAAEALPF